MTEALAFQDAETGQVLWRQHSWPEEPNEEIKVEIPAQILSCNAVAREVRFSSVELMNSLKMQQLVYMDTGDGLAKIEEWNFDFGFVIPGSTNSWQSTTLAAGSGKMVDPKVASGRVVIVTRFLDQDKVVSEMRVRVYYI